MRLFNTLCFTLLSISLSFAQITIDTSDVPPFDTKFYYALDTILSGVGPGPDGAGQSWDFTDLDTNQLDTTLVVDPALTPAGAMFPDAAFALESEDLYSYMGIDEIGLYALGGSLLQQGFEFTVAFDPPQQLLANPTTLGTTFTNEFGFELEIDGSPFNTDSVRVRQSGTADAAVNASGTLTVPAGSFETLRLTTEVVTMDSIFVKLFGNWLLIETIMDTTVIHEWWAEGGIGTVATLEMDTDGNPISLQYLIDYFQPAAPPAAAFSSEVVGNGILQFTDQSVNEPTEWFWDFGDGNSSQEQNPQHTYEESGTYDVCLTVTNTGGSDTACETINITIAPVAAFTTDLVGNGAIQFNDESANEPTEWLWDFGDGNSSQEQNPQHTYEESGAYEACLTVTNAAGSDTACETVNITIAPVAAFTTDLVGNGAIQFNDESANEPDEWLWDFGDGNSSQEQNPQHTYEESGAYEACLTVTNAAGSDTACETINITIAPVAAFTTDLVGNGAIQFNDESANEPNEWLWDFGDGNSSQEQNPQHTYEESGAYEACLTVTNAGGSDTACETLDITIAPVAAFTAELVGNGAIQFNDESANEPDEWLWDFGDGNSSQEQNPQHTYEESGAYEACLTVTNAAGSDTACETLDITIAPVEPPVAAFTAELVGNGAIQFNDESANEPDEWLWDFGDGNSSQEQNPQHTYEESGAYEACLTVTNAGGSDTACETINITIAPIAAFTAELVGNGAVQFNDESANEPDEWLWDFGDGNTSQEQNPQHTYEESGAYEACLTVTNAGGSDTACETLDITIAPIEPPVAAFTAELVGNGAVQFNDESANEPDEWLWDFGDGNSSQEQNPEHVYAETGSYDVCLIATNEGGSDTSCKTLSITITSTSEVKDPDMVRIYPNPVNDRLNVFAKGLAGKPIQVMIYNAQGQLVQQARIEAAAQNWTLEVSQLMPGTFYLEVLLRGRTYQTSAFTKQ